MASETFTFYIQPWYRKSPYFEATKRHGCKSWGLYNHMLLPTLYDDPVTFDPTALVQREIRLQGSIAYTSEDFREAVRLLSTGEAEVGPLVTHRKPLEQIGEAFCVQLQKDESIKVLVTP